MNFHFITLVLMLFFLSKPIKSNKVLTNNQNEEDLYFMNIAINEAKIGLKEGGIPIGSVLVSKNKILGKGHNQLVQKNQPILHGEMDAINNAGRLDILTYEDSTLYTTLSPCSMCSGTALLFHIKRVVICDNINFKSENGEDLLKSKGVEITVLNLNQCVEMMGEFIKNNKELWNNDAGLIPECKSTASGLFLNKKVKNPEYSSWYFNTLAFIFLCFSLSLCIFFYKLIILENGVKSSYNKVNNINIEEELDINPYNLV